MDCEYPSLPYDYSRCMGIVGEVVCYDCLRHTIPGRKFWQPFISPSRSEEGLCEYKITQEVYNKGLV